MLRVMMKSKIHRASVTQADLHYEGSLTISGELMKAADILPYEMVHVYNVTNGERFETYALEGEAGSGIICLNGAAARKGAPRDAGGGVSDATLSRPPVCACRDRLAGRVCRAAGRGHG